MKITYYQNLYNEMITCGFYTYGTPAPGINAPVDAYINSPKENGRDTSPIGDSAVFEKMIRQGELQIKYRSAAERKFVGTTISEDNAIQEVKDERKLALAEAKYVQDMTGLERKDKKFDLELKKLDTEHSALQTEYESVKNVIDKNIEKTFNMFS
jgi:hypothetical protein